jgi:4-hydroxy-tetrahydrodipicolinate synthase
MFEGVIPAIVTPFTSDGRVDCDGLAENLQFLADTGISAVVPCGTTGESATLSIEEHNEVIDCVLEHSKVPVIAGTGSNNTTEALMLTKHAEDAGADAALLITPYYNKPNKKGLIKHFTTIAGSVEIPIILYNVPGRTKLNMTPDVVSELAEVENIIGIKEASGDLQQVSEIIELTQDMDFSVFSGDDALTLPILSFGGCGVISVAANLVPERVVAMVKAFEEGDLQRARELHFELAPLIRALFLETNPIPVKMAMNMCGFAGGPLRLPLHEGSPETEAALRKALTGLGVL